MKQAPAEQTSTHRFTAGQTVIHPHHGPATVTEVFSREVQGTVRTFVGLAINRTDLQIAVPLAKLEEVGVRPVYDREEVDALLEVLRSPSPEQDGNWSRRVKANHDRLRLGDLRATAGVVRDLMRRERDHGLSPSEREMMVEASRLVYAEVALALDLPDEEAQRMVDDAVLEQDLVG